MKYRLQMGLLFYLGLTLTGLEPVIGQSQQNNQGTYEDLVSFFEEWRAFENPPLREGAPDYTKDAFENRLPQFKELQRRFKVIDTSKWSIENQVDWHIVKAEMNGYDFNDRILKPWTRDPEFYKSLWMDRSDVPAHEGPTHHVTIELWTYEFPLSSKERTRLLGELKVIAPLNEQARHNLTGNAKELWIAGIEPCVRKVKT